MIKTEKHLVKSKNYIKEIDNLMFLSKNLYNYSLYQIRQHYFETKKIITYTNLYKLVRYEKDYQSLPTKVSKWVLNILYENINSFFKALKSYLKTPSKFKSCPKFPKYLKKDERFITIYERDALNIKGYKKTGLIKLSKTNIFVKSKIPLKDIKQITLTKQNCSYSINVIYEDNKIPPINLNNNWASIDLGVNNLAVLTSNIKNFKPIIYNGKILKSLNQGFNKRLAKNQSKLQKGICTSKKIRKEYDKRERRISDYLHVISKNIVNQLVSNNTTNLVIGYNKGWKQDINIGAVNNQKFVNIPFLKFIQLLEYKCLENGINFRTITEEYTSKCSFIDNELLQKQEVYKGSRIKRGLFKTSNKTINSDVNGSYNILRKVISDFKYEIGANVVSTVIKI